MPADKRTGFDWNAMNAPPWRRRLPYLPDTDAAKWYVIHQAVINAAIIRPVVVQPTDPEGWSGLIGCMFSSLN